MKRFKDQKCGDIILGFKEKLSISDFEKRNDELKDYLRKIPWKDKKGGGQIETSVSEISTLYSLSQHYSASHIQWTGDQDSGHPFDGILFFNQNQNKIEITSLIHKKSAISFREKNRYQMSHESIIRTFNCPDWIFGIEAAEKIIRERANMGLRDYPTVVIEDFLYENLVNLFKKKNKKKYENLWMVVNFNSISFLSEFIYKDIRNYVFNKIINNEKKLVISLEKIFKKIIFLPFGMEDNIFEWDRINN